MSAENGDAVVFAQPAPVNGDRSLVNGLTNGHSSSSSSSKHRSSSSSGGHKSSSKDKHRSSSSSSKSHHSSSGSSSNKDKTSSSSSSSKPSGSSSSSAHKSSSSSSSSNRDKDKDRHKHGSSSSSSRDKDRKSGSSSHKSSSSSSKDHKSSSSRDKDKHRSSSSSTAAVVTSSTTTGTDMLPPPTPTKTSSSSSSRDDKSSKDRHHKSSSSSSSSKHKHSSSSSSSSKHRSSDKDKDRHHHSSSSSSKTGGSSISKSGSSKHNDSAAPIGDVAIAAADSPDNCVEVDVVDPLALTAAQQPIVKLEPIGIGHYNNSMNASQASSCDYSMSQFKPDESQFSAKAEPEDDDDDEDNQQVSFGGGRAIKHENDDDDEEEDAPIAKRFKVVKSEQPSAFGDDSDEDAPILAKKIKTEKVKKAKKKKHQSDDEDDDDYDDAPIMKKPKKEKKAKVIAKPPPVVKRESLNSNASPTKAGGRKKKEAEPEEVWKWWEEEKRDDGVKWNFLEHRGPVFAPPYEPLPANVPFEYDGRVMKLSQDAEEIACFYAKMLNHDFTSKPVFNDNFFGDWRKAMTSKEKEKITKLKNCNFQKMFEHFQAVSERNKSRTKDEKAALKAENEALMAEYGFCTIDGHKEKIGNFRIEPPGLFRGRGEHPKMGKVKRRVLPEDIMINCARGSKVPEAPAGHRWREVKHDNAVTWLASWTENVQGQVKYVMLNPSSKLKGEKDWQKYETARRLHKHIDRIRHAYKEEWKSKEMRIRQRGVALYFIDKLALRAGNEKDEDQADTVGCCSLRVEHIQLHRQLNGLENVVVFDFLGKDSIRYYNEVEVEKRVFKNLELFKENKKAGDDLFDRLNTVVMNEHLRELMDGLTAKVFRTYNASWTLQCQLNEMTDGEASLPEKLLAYNRANRAVAVLCNHQRAVPKSHEKSMENLKEKIRAKREQVDDLQVEVKDAIKEAKHGSVKEKMNADKKKKALQRAQEQLKKMELQETDRDENKTIALGTSKLNYLDPRISVAWCKKYDVPIDKIYNKTQRDKFRWAIDMATEDYQF